MNAAISDREDALEIAALRDVEKSRMIQVRHPEEGATSGVARVDVDEKSSIVTERALRDRLTSAPFVPQLNEVGPRGSATSLLPFHFLFEPRSQP